MRYHQHYANIPWGEDLGPAGKPGPTASALAWLLAPGPGTRVADKPSCLQPLLLCPGLRFGKVPKGRCRCPQDSDAADSSAWPGSS